MKRQRSTQFRGSNRRLGFGPRGFTLVEVMIALGVIGVILMPAVGTIQLMRVQSRTVGLHLIGQNLAVAMTELVKRSGYSEIAYGQQLPGILDTSTVVNPLLDFPRSSTPGADPSQENLPLGAPGGASVAAIDTFLSRLHTGDPDYGSPVLTGDANYFFLSNDQVAALNGYANMDAVPDEERERLLDPGYAWAVSIRNGDPLGEIGGGMAMTGVKHLVVIVKWTDPSRNRPDFAVVESFVAEVAPRM